jgi:transposase
MSKLLYVRHDANLYLYRRPVKMSRSFDGLAALIRTELGKDIVHGDIFIFLNRTRSMVKVLVYEDKGFSIFYRRLDEGSFLLPMIAGEAVSYKMTADQLVNLLSGLEVEDGVQRKAGRYEPLHGAAV